MSELKKNMKSIKGQGVLEYIILTSLIGIFCLIAVKQIGGSLNTRLKYIDKKITNDIKIR